MERENWLGVCCEPNSIFVICNQFPVSLSTGLFTIHPNSPQFKLIFKLQLIAMRYNDVRDGTNIVEDVLKKYTAAWKEKGMVQEDGLFVDFYSPNQDKVAKAQRIGFTAW
jgi:hypothetical protein